MPQSTVQTFILFLLMAAGFAAGRMSILDAETVKRLSRFLVAFILPCLIVASMQKPLTPELRGEAFKVLGLSFAVYSLSFPLAFLLVRGLGLRGPMAGVHSFGAVFANVAFMGFPVMEALFGKAVLFEASIYNIPFQLLAFSVGAAMIASGTGHRAGLRLASFVTPAGVAAVIGMGLFLLGVALPFPIFKAMSLLGDTTTPVSMALIGATLSRTDLKSALSDWRLWASSVYRLLLIPVTLWFALRTLGFSGILLGMPVMMAAMPAAVNASILAAAYGGDVDTASALVFLSTAASLATIPLLANLLFGI